MDRNTGPLLGVDGKTWTEEAEDNRRKQTRRLGRLLHFQVVYYLYFAWFFACLGSTSTDICMGVAACLALDQLALRLL
jgi:hypothetical protein